MSPREKSFKRGHQTRWTVKAADHVAKSLITVGGIGTIIAVSTVCLFLFYVALPLILPASMEETSTYQVEGADVSPLHVGIDDYQTMGWSLLSNGKLDVFRLDDGSLLSEKRLFEDGKDLRSASFAIESGDMALGFADGSYRLASIEFRTQFLDMDAVDESHAGMEIGEVAPSGEGLITRVSDEQYRLLTVVTKLDDPIEKDDPSPIVLIDYAISSSGSTVCMLREDGKMLIDSVKERKNLMTGKVTYKIKEAELPYEAHEGQVPRFLKLSGLGDTVYAIWPDGHTIRYDTGDFNEITVAENLDLLTKPGVEVTAVHYLIGKSTLIVGDSEGDLTAWFLTKPDEATTIDGALFTRAHELPSGSSAVTAMAASARMRSLAAGFADGTVRLYHVTTNQLLVEAEFEHGQPVEAIALAPKDDGLVGWSAHGTAHWNVDLKYPEARLASLFLPVWYEHYESPEHVWQSSSGTDDFEPKLGLWPLIFGTLKATIYSMLFGAPLALLAAIYTSEFLRPEFKAKIKPTIELMASLPSVVLGFLAALVFAPFIEDYVGETLAVILMVPFTFLLFAYLWQLLPYQWLLRLENLRFPVICGLFPLGLYASFKIGPFVEHLLFEGNIKSWLDGQVGGPMAGWLLLFFPLSAVMVILGSVQYVDPWVMRKAISMSRRRAALIDFGKFLCGIVATFGLAFVFSGIMAMLGFDARGNVFGTYVQRNALIVGFVMGFAIIPIIYTIAEDALSTVPKHLRAGSLGAGATQWQTATRIIIPTAMSGLFSALMIGLGRAVGETMIVLMAAGNTPVMDWNIFNGFRTLSANIAVELPEAVRNSTHYRTLFLAALTLFIMTFIVNTVAEMIRLRFRKRAYEL